MAEQIDSTKPKHVGEKIVATATALALTPLAGCSVSQERQAMQNVAHQVFTDVVAGKTVSKDPFGDNTFTVSIKDKYPSGEQQGDISQQAESVYALGMERTDNVLGLNDLIYNSDKSEWELRAVTACNTAAVSGLLTAEDIQKIQGQWDYYQQLGGEEEIKKGGTHNEAFFAIAAMKDVCMNTTLQGLENGRDVTFVPASNDA